MENKVEEILSMSDKELLFWLISDLRAQYESGVESRLKLIDAALTMRATIRNAAYTRHLALSSWAIAAITLITQATLIILTLSR